ncbi:MAG: Hsp20/alpha crystallin family protein [Eubacteriaceae bacterium]|nr:Hsp20/alpha crystallin family protein [Eubacteriaceae bacterium]
MLMPKVWNDNFFDDWMGGFPAVTNYFGKQDTEMMKTDVKETDNGYDVEIDLPGFKKDDVNAELSDGYLTVTANRTSENDEKDKDGKYIRRERYQGSCSRSYYVGDGVTEDDIKAKFENGILKMEIPKKDQKEIDEQKKLIAIEG